MRELSIFVDESGDFGPFESHSPFYILSLVFHDQSDDINGHLVKIHDGLMARGLSAEHAVHAGPLIRREQEYRWMDLPSRRAIFRLLVDFFHRCQVTHHSWVFSKRELDADQLVTMMSRAVGALIREHYSYFAEWERIVIYYDNGQKEITNLVNSVFNAENERALEAAKQAAVWAIAKTYREASGGDNAEIRKIEDLFDDVAGLPR